MEGGNKYFYSSVRCQSTRDCHHEFFILNLMSWFCYLKNWVELKCKTICIQTVSGEELDEFFINQNIGTFKFSFFMQISTVSSFKILSKKTMRLNIKPVMATPSYKINLILFPVLGANKFVLFHLHGYQYIFSEKHHLNFFSVPSMYQKSHQDFFIGTTQLRSRVLF